MFNICFTFHSPLWGGNHYGARGQVADSPTVNRYVDQLRKQSRTKITRITTMRQAGARKNLNLLPGNLVGEENSGKNHSDRVTGLCV